MNVSTFLKVQTAYRTSRRRHSSGPMGRPLRGGFTLVELLVVVAIIALLVSILLPTLNKAKDQAKAVVCLTRLKSIMLATSLYVHEHNGWVHAAYGGSKADGGDGRTWYWAMADEELLPNPWDSELSHCPLTNVASWPHDSFYGYGMRASYSPGSGGYYGAEGLYGTGYYHIESPFVRRRAGLESNSVFTHDFCPGDFVLYMDSRRSGFIYSGNGQWYPPQQWYLVFDVPCSPDDEDCRVHLRHSDRANCAFADGHAMPVGRDGLNDLGFEDGSIWPEP